MHAPWNDLKYAVRQLRRSPGFALTVVLTLALGVGANAIVFSVLSALVLKPLPVRQASQLVFLDRLGNAGTAASSSATQSYPDYRAFRDRSRSFSGLAAYALDRAGIGPSGAVRQSWLTVALAGRQVDLHQLRPLRQRGHLALPRRERWSGGQTGREGGERRRGGLVSAHRS